MSGTQTTTLSAFADLFGSLAGGSVFVAPADAEIAARAFRALRIRPSEGHVYDINGFGVCQTGRGVEALIFEITSAAKGKLRAAGMIDRDRIITAGS